MINFILWNIRGLANKPSKRRVKKLFFIHNLPFIAFLEPNSKPQMIEELRRTLKFEGCTVNSSNKIWFLWRYGVNCTTIKSEDQCMLLNISHFRGVSLYCLC